MPGGGGTMIPVMKRGLDSKVAKTEKNRLQLIMQRQDDADDDDEVDKEKRIDLELICQRDDDSRAKRRTSVPRCRDKVK